MRGVRGLLRVVAVGLIVLVPTLGYALDDEGKEIKVSEVPAELLAKVKMAVPNAKWTGATKYDVMGEVSYTVEGEFPKGQGVWVDIYADGTLGEISRDIAVKAVPPVVMKALRDKFPKFKITGVYEIKEDGQIIRYDFEGRRIKDKEDIGIYISADGKTIEVDE